MITANLIYPSLLKFNLFFHDYIGFRVAFFFFYGSIKSYKVQVSNFGSKITQTVSAPPNTNYMHISCNNGPPRRHFGQFHASIANKGMIG